MKRVCKKGQMKLSFGMIFSIILIIIFVAFAFYAITKFLDLKNKVEIGKFIEDLEEDIDKLWKGAQGSQEVEYFIPKKIEYVCFVDFDSVAGGEDKNFYINLRKAKSSEENLVFYPVGSAGGLDSKKIEHINIESITEINNPYCIKQSKGKVKLILEKDFSESLVRIS